MVGAASGSVLRNSLSKAVVQLLQPTFMLPGSTARSKGQLAACARLALC